MEKETLNTTTNSRIYKLLFRKYLLNVDGLCPICPPHRGCNYRRKKHQKNWKYFRKKQWKDPVDRGTAS